MKKLKFNSNIFIYQTQYGRSMIEMLGVLAIMAVITVLSIMAYTMAMTNIRVNNAKSDIAMIVQQIKTIYPYGDYSGLSECTSKTNEYYDKFVATGLMGTKNAFGTIAKSLIYNCGQTQKTGYGVVSGRTYINGGGWISDKTKFSVFINNINKKECNLLAAQNWEGIAKNAAGVPLIRRPVDCYAVPEGQFVVTFE